MNRGNEFVYIKLLIQILFAALTRCSSREAKNNVLHINRLRTSLKSHSYLKRKYLIEIINNRKMLKYFMNKKDAQQVVVGISGKINDNHTIFI